MAERKCKTCGVKFDGRSDARYCGATRRQRGKRKRDAPPVTGGRRHQFGPGPVKRGGKRHSTTARDVTAAIIETCADLGTELRQIYIGSLRDEDAPTVEQVDAAMAGVQAITCYLQDLRHAPRTTTVRSPCGMSG